MPTTVTPTGNRKESLVEKGMIATTITPPGDRKESLVVTESPTVQRTTGPQ